MYFIIKIIILLTIYSQLYNCLLLLYLKVFFFKSPVLCIPGSNKLSTEDNDNDPFTN